MLQPPQHTADAHNTSNTELQLPTDTMVGDSFGRHDRGIDVGPSTGQDDSDLVSWANHAIDAYFQAQTPDFLNPASLASGPVLPEQGISYSGWAGVAMPDYSASFPNVSEFTSEAVLPPSVSSVAFPLASDSQATTPFDNVGEPPMVVPAAVDQETLLRTLREAGYGFAEIAEEMQERLGIKVTANALVKRYGKMPKTLENLVAEALKNIMPRIMEEVYAELPQIDDGTLSQEEKQTLSQLVQELPQVLPKCIRGKLSRRRKNMQPSASL